MNAVVIGGCGFIGSAIVRAVRRSGFEAAVVRRAAPGISDAEIIVREQVEILDPAVVVHAASAPATTSERVRFAEESQLIETLARIGAPTIVIGSASVIAGAVPDAGERYSEAAAPNPLTDYGRFKQWQETAVLAHRANRWPVSVLRFFNPLGPGMRPDLMLGHLAAALVRRERDRRLPVRIEMRSLSGVRDFIHVDDAADAVVAVSAGKELPSLLHVATGIGTATRDLARLALAYSLRPDLELIETAARSGDGAEARVVGDASRLRQLTGWTPSRTLVAAVADTLAAERIRQDRGDTCIESRLTPGGAD